jgi:uncharacterized membrane protein
MEIARKIFMILFTYMMINSVVFAEAALSLGSVQVSRTAEANAGEDVQLKLLLFNAHEKEDLIISMNYKSPSGWSVQISPQEFNLPYKEIGDISKEDGYEFLATGLGDVKTKPVWINVGVPDNELTGTYEVKININARRSGSGISMSQSRSHTFIIHVNGAYSQDSQPEEGQDEETQKSSPQPNPSQTGTENKEQPNNQNDGIIQNENSTQLTSQNDITGMIISNPLFGPILIGIVVIVFVLLRVFKRI